MYEKLKVYNNYANECIFFKYIFDEADLKDEENESAAADSSSRSKKQPTNGGGKENHMNGVIVSRSGSSGSKSDNCKQVFKPEFTHQIFGDDESIFGYRNLRVDYYLTPGLLEAYIGLKYKDKVNAQRFDGIEPDDVYDAFTKFGCSPGFTRQLDVFVSEKLKKDIEFRPFGNKIHEYKSTAADSSAESTFEVYKVDSKCPEVTSERFLNYMDRIQTMLVYYIETSCFIDSEDPQWSYFILYEKKGKTNSDCRYVTCGFISVYEYYAYPDKVRSRISQMLIFPTYQNMGHGSRLMESVYMDACQVSNILEVTAESPSDEFIHLRDYVTCKMCATLDSFRSKDALKKGFSNEMAQEALSKFKLSRLQSRRCYEILRLAITNQSKSDEWRDYRLDLKKRFYLPFIRRTKFARGSGASTSAAAAAAAGSSTSAADEPSKSASFSDRFGGKASNAFSRLNGGSSSTIVEEDEDEYSGKTTIGFGRPTAQTVESTSIGFGSSSSSEAASSKSVSFSNQIKNDLAKVFANGLKKANLANGNGANSSLDNSNHDDEDDDDDDDDDSDASSDAGGVPITDQPNLTNLLVSPEERKKYLEEKFQESIVEYRKVIRRLENANIIS